jgi:hypothetical protein
MPIPRRWRDEEMDVIDDNLINIGRVIDDRPAPAPT